MAQKTTEHDRIRQWAELRGGRPAIDENGVKIDFAGENQDISWDEFFQEFDERGMVMVYEERNQRGQLSHFHQFNEA